MKIHPLPPLTALVTFESAARHLSFTESAEELHVTQGAVSRQVRLIEDFLGEKLFERNTREVSLTATGSRYYEAIMPALQQIAWATGKLTQSRSTRTLTVMTSSAMASLWLLPRVGEFQRTHEDIDLRIVAYDQVKDHSTLECDAALYYCRTPPRDMKVTPLFSEEVFPVCAPGYLASHPQLSRFDSLHESTWLWLDRSQRDWIDWEEWFKLLGHTPRTPRQSITINNYSMVLQQAITGQGLALGWSNLISDHLETGALIRPVDTILQTDAKFCLMVPSNRPGNHALAAEFSDWIMTQIP